MTVQELIEELQKLPMNYIVVTTRANYSANNRIADGIKYLGSGQVLITSHVPED